LGKVSEECDTFGIPLLAMMYPRGPKIQSEHAVEVVSHAARIGAELGADIIKTNFTGTVDSFKQVTESCPAPVVIAGGPKTETQREVFDFVYDGMQKGAAGVNLGRNIWQTQYAVASIRAIRAIIHDGYNVQEADDLYNQIVAGKA
jgi:fructose-bisphosphate aldolase/2-amino-3,7-dideoxy-D-threo-hept-6-ulosonate synthase